MGMKRGRRVQVKERYAYDLLHLAWSEQKIYGWWIYSDDEWEIAWTETDRHLYTFAQIRELVGQPTRRARTAPKPVECPHCGAALAA